MQLVLEHRVSSHKNYSKLMQGKQMRSIQLKKILSSEDTLGYKFKKMGEHYIGVAGNSDHSIKLYAMKDLKLKYEFMFHSKTTTCIDYSEEFQSLVVGSRDTRISVWQMGPDHSFKNDPTLVIYGHKQEVYAIL